MQYIWGIFGIVVVLFIGFLFSRDKKAINYRTILGALVIQFLFGFIVLKWDTGRMIFEKITAVVQRIIDTSTEGINFVFGGLFEAEGIGFVFAFQVLTVIIFFSALVSVLFYLGVMQFITKIIGGFLAKILQTSRAESISSAANIFVGLTEAPLVVKPYLEKMTRSELFVVMTGGAASVSGSVLVGYSLMGIPLEYLIAAAFMAAPAGILMAKLIMPETEKPVTDENITFEKDTETTNVIDAASKGAMTGLNLALSIGAILLAFISLIALINLGLGWIGGWFGLENLTLEQILGYIFSPLAFVVGVPWEEAVQAGSYIGQKFVLNEFVAYGSLSADMHMLSEKTIIVSSFVLCGFANLGALGMFIGGIGELAPSRRGELTRYGLLAIIGGTLANLLSAAMAGMLL